MSTPHILVDALVLRPPMCGALRYALELLPRAARLLAAQDGLLTLALTRHLLWQPEWVQNLEQAGIRIQWQDRPMRPGRARWKNESACLKSILEDLRRTGSPATLLQTQSLPLPRKKALGALPRIHLCHGLRPLRSGHAGRRMLARALQRRALLQVDATLCVSHHLKDLLQALEPKARLEVVTPGSEHATCEPVARSSQWLWIGPADPHKGLEVLLGAMQLDASLPNLTLLADDAGLDKHRALLEELSPRVRCEPALHAKEVSSRLVACAGVVLPSRLESFGMLALEALRTQTPMVLSDIPAHREVVRDVTQGVEWFANGDAEDCSQALRKIGLSPEAGDSMYDQAQSFLWETSARQTVDLWLQFSPPA